MNFNKRCLDYVGLTLFAIVSFTAVMMIIYVQRAINLECNVLVTTCNKKLCNLIIHPICSLVCDWSKHVTWANIPQLKLGNIRGYSPIFKTNG